jgi:competence protein CoiA
MNFAKSKKGYLLALNAQLEDGPFHCPECRYEVILKKGDIYTHHFAHNPGEGCSLGDVEDGEGAGESDLHRFAKKDIAEALSKHKEVRNLRLERSLGSVRPDISFVFNGVPVAIEFQRSAIRPDVIQHRTIEYSRRGIFILWLSPYGEATELNDGRVYSMRDWERVIHALYGGTFYYWKQDEQLLPVHFENDITHKSAVHLSTALERARMRPDVLISDLSQVFLSFRFTRESHYLETKLWGITEVWVDARGGYVEVSEAKAKYPSLYPSVRPLPPLDDPFHIEPAPSDFILRGFVEELVPELKPLFLAFYAKYGMIDHSLIWVSIDQTPNRMYFAPDWWYHFRSEYIEANMQRKEQLLEMFQEKLSGEKPNRHVKWP